MASAPGGVSEGSPGVSGAVVEFRENGLDAVAAKRERFAHSAVDPFGSSLILKARNSTRGSHSSLKAAVARCQNMD